MSYFSFNKTCETLLCNEWKYPYITSSSFGFVSFQIKLTYQDYAKFSLVEFQQSLVSNM